jgi:hypothetical protein
MVPAIGIWGEKRGKHKVSRWEIILASYVCLQMTISFLIR